MKNAEEKPKAKAKCINRNDETKTIYLVLAVYENDVLKSYKKQSCVVAPGDNDIEVEITGFVYSNGMSAELFVWGDENIPKLITKTYTIK